MSHRAATQSPPHITSLDIQNFKSFGKDIQTLSFVSGTNVIIGRNGMGKSNSLDAILAAFGVPTSKLRTKSMSDLFHKSGLNTAKQLSITLSLSNDSKIKLQISADKMQRLFTLNGKRITHKELTFHLSQMGINLHSENPSFLIQQNTISLIPQMSAEQLADLICDASGSLTFHTKVQEAYQKLEQWEQTEKTLKENMQTIERQFEEWKEYQQMEQECEQLKGELSNVEREIQRMDRARAREQLKALTEDEKRTSHQLEHVKQSMCNASSQRASLVERLEKLQMDTHSETFHLIESSIQQQRIQHAQFEQEVRILAKQLADLKKTQHERERQRAQLKRELKEAKHLESIAKAATNTTTNHSAEDMKQLRNEIDTKTSTLHRLEQQEFKLSSKQQSFTDSLLKLESEVHDSQNATYAALLQLETEMLHVSLSLRKYKGNSTPLHLPSALKQDPNTIGYALECFKWRLEACSAPIIAALSRVCESKVSTLVAKSSLNIEHLISVIKSTTRQGINVWCLDRVRYHELQQKQREFEAAIENCAMTQVVVAAKELVECDPKFHPIVLKLFGQVAVCETDADAHALAKVLPCGVVVSQDECNIHRARGFSVRGGEKRVGGVSHLMDKYEMQASELERQRDVTRKEELKVQVEKLKTHLEVKKELSTVKRTLGEVKEEMAALESELSVLWAKTPPVDSEVPQSLESPQYYAEQIVALEDQLELIQEECTTRTEQLGLLQISLYKLQAQCDDAAQRVVQLDAECEAHRNEQQRLGNQSHELEESINTIVAQLDEWKLEIQALTQKKNGLEEHIREMSHNLNDMDEGDEMTDDPEHSTPHPEIQKRCKLLQLELNDREQKTQEKGESLSTTNLTHQATSWKLIKDRFTALQKENHDLREFIAEAEEQVRVANLHSFASISQLFSRYVSQLLPGKSGALVAVDETDIARGVKFEVQEDEKPCVLSQLSGGQKSLLAVCFIFAIGAHCASPFFLLDEIDAALDENNQQRLSSFLKQFSASGQQFIFVSHHANSQKVAQRVISIDVANTGGASTVMGLKDTTV